MARGVLSGIGLGAVFSVGVAGVVSVLVPMAPAPAPQLGNAGDIAPVAAAQPPASLRVTDEAGNAVAAPRFVLRAPEAETEPRPPLAAAKPPQITSDLAGAAAPSPVPQTDIPSAPKTDGSAALPVPQTPPAAGAEAQSDAPPAEPLTAQAPQTGQASSLTAPRPLPESIAARAEEDTPVLPNPQALAPMIPDDSTDGEINSAAAAPPTAPSPPADPTGPAASQEPAEPDPAQESFVLVEPAVEADQPEQDEQTAQARLPRILPAPGTVPLVTDSGIAARPRIGTPANTLAGQGEQPVGTPQTSQIFETETAGTTPLETYGQPFDNPEGKPLMSIILMDTGADLDAAEIGLPALSSFPYPVSFAVDARLVDAAARVARYRAEGFDVLAMVDLPAGARPADAEVSISVALNGMPEIVGIMEGTGEGLQNSREVADQVTGILAASGHGLVAQAKGLNSMPKLALKKGVAAAPVFRDFDAEGQQARVIRRFLDQAAFKAAQEDGVIMLGRLRPETIEALLVWGLADRAGSVALAPVSALLRAQK